MSTDKKKKKTSYIVERDAEGGRGGEGKGREGEVGRKSRREKRESGGGAPTPFAITTVGAWRGERLSPETANKRNSSYMKERGRQERRRGRERWGGRGKGGRVKRENGGDGEGEGRAGEGEGGRGGGGRAGERRESGGGAPTTFVVTTVGAWRGEVKSRTENKRKSSYRKERGR